MRTRVDVGRVGTLPAGFIIMHANLNMSNMTTIEMYEKKKLLPWRFDRGRRHNMLEVFGLNPWTWLIPVHTPNQLHRLLHISRVSGGRWERRNLPISFPPRRARFF